MTPVYLDSNSTTPIDPAVLDAMLPYLRGEFGNPSSSHALGHRAHDAVAKARAQVAALIGAQPEEIIFTGGGTEASNMAIRGAAAMDATRRSIVTTTIEHPATEACCSFLERHGHTITRIRCAPNGIVAAQDVIAAIGNSTALVTIIHAQNEIGTLQPVAEIAKQRSGARLHVDAAQSIGKIAVDVNELGADLLSIAGHKLYAPKGIGALYARRGLRLPPLLLGAGQENGRRPGTENVPYIVALGEACRLAGLALTETPKRLAGLSQNLLGKLKASIPGLILAGDAEKRLPNTLNALFPNMSGRDLLAACPGVLASNGSACHAGSEEPSAILLALGYSRDVALGTVRLSLGRHTTSEDVERAASHLIAAWQKLSSRMSRARAAS
jgi:cysteine desulfurase